MLTARDEWQTTMYQWQLEQRRETGSLHARTSHFITDFVNGWQSAIYDDCPQSHDFVFITDVIRALWTDAVMPGIAGRIFNMGNNGKASSILRLAYNLGAILNASVRPIPNPHVQVK